MTVPAARPTGPATTPDATPAPDLRPADRTVFGPVGVDATALGGAAREVVDVTVVDDGDHTTTVTVRGELLQETVATFAAAVEDLAADPAVRVVVVDLSVTSFMDSTGLGALVTLRNRVRHRGAAFRVVRPDERVFRLFELTRLDGFFEFVDGG